MHSVALIAVETAFPGSQKVWTKSLLVAGMTMFSGSIYMLVLDPQRFKVMGPITPLGGGVDWRMGGVGRCVEREERCVALSAVLCQTNTDGGNERESVCGLELDYLFYWKSVEVLHA
jgi:hypothetical protein